MISFALLLLGQSGQSSESGFEVVEPRDYRITLTNLVTAYKVENNRIEVVTPVPPNLPTQKVFKHRVEVEDGRVVTDKLIPCDNGTTFHYMVVEPIKATVKIMSITEVRLWRETGNPGLVTDRPMPKFRTSEKTLSFNYDSQAFKAWVARHNATKSSDEDWVTYLNRTYKTFDECWNYSHGTGGFPVHDLEHAVQSKRFGCQTAAMVFTGLLRSQEIQSFQVFGGVVYPTSAAHSFSFANIPGYGWKLFDPTLALSGQLDLTSPYHYFVHHVAQSGFLKIEGVKDRVPAHLGPWEFTCINGNTLPGGTLHGDPSNAARFTTTQIVIKQ